VTRDVPWQHIVCICRRFWLMQSAQDRRPIRESDLVEMPPPTEATQAPVREVEDEDGMEGKSDKIDQLIHLLRLTPATDRSLVFSQFTSFLDRVSRGN
jgi:SWI/SNF-related matrix-associated actin-dependent regulator of chromatin subfamily A3